MTDTFLFPTLTPLEEMPLHSSHGPYRNLPPSSFACRGGDLFDWRCADCVAEAKWDLEHQGDLAMTWFHEETSQEEIKPLSWLIARSEFWGVK